MKLGNAKEKWCPMTAGAFSSKCFASDCMAWRWINQDSGFCGLAGPLLCTAGSGISRPTDISESEENLIDKFVYHFCDLRAGNEIAASELYENFSECGLLTMNMSAKRFGQIITRNCERVKRGGTVYYKGIALK